MEAEKEGCLMLRLSYSPNCPKLSSAKLLPFIFFFFQVYQENFKCRHTVNWISLLLDFSLIAGHGTE